MFKKRTKLFSAISLFVLFVCFLPFAEAATGTPTIFSYQGRLTDASGTLLGSSSGTTYYFKFSIWDVSTGGVAGTNRLWPSSGPTSFATSVRSGVFNANIGDTANGYPDTLNYNFNTNKDIYLQVEVSSDNATFETLSPRQRISSTPFAQVAGAVSGMGQSSFGTTTPVLNTVVTIESTSTSAIPILLRGFAGQTANLFNIQDSSLNNLFSVNASGGLFASSTLLIGSTTGATSFVVDLNGNVGVGTGAPSRKLNVFNVNSTPQFRFSQSASVYGELYADSVGDVSISSTGGNIRANDENLWVCSGGSCGATAPAGKGNVIVETGVIFNNNFKLKQIDASTTVMYDTTNTEILEFDEGQ